MTTPAAAAPGAPAASATDAPTPTPPAPQPPSDSGPVYDAVLVGGGPRAVAVVERLAARRADAAPPVRIAVIDAVEVGAGATWRTDQSPLLLNNTYSAHTTIHADASTRMSGPVVPGPDLITWARDSEPPPDRPAWVAQEASELRPWSFPTRRLQGVYYREQLARAEATGRVTVTRVLGSVTDLSPAPDGRTVHLTDGRSYTGRRVVLAQGMVQAKRSPRVAAFVRAAADHDLVYVEPGMPAERDWTRVPADETVLVAGLGANFFDVVALLTEGRGGRFTPAGDGDRPARLRYLPSGREPRLVAGSRRGLPYRAKADYPDGFPPRYEPALATPAWFAERAAGRGQDFRRDVWPQLAREFAWAHLSTLLAHHPEALRPAVGADDLLAALRGASDDAAIDTVITAALAPARPSPGAADRATAATTGHPGAPAATVTPDPRRWALSVSRLDRPHHPGPVDSASWHQAVRHHIDAELDSIHNPLTSPRNTVNRAMAALRGPVRRLATAGGAGRGVRRPRRRRLVQSAGSRPGLRPTAAPDRRSAGADRRRRAGTPRRGHRGDGGGRHLRRPLRRRARPAGPRPGVRRDPHVEGDRHRHRRPAARRPAEHRPGPAPRTPQRPRPRRVHWDAGRHPGRLPPPRRRRHTGPGRHRARHPRRGRPTRLRHRRHPRRPLPPPRRRRQRRSPDPHRHPNPHRPSPRAPVTPVRPAPLPARLPRGPRPPRPCAHNRLHARSAAVASGLTTTAQPAARKYCRGRSTETVPTTSLDESPTFAPPIHLAGIRIC